jgi:DNA-binding transcriptional MerR regulator
MDPTTQGSGHLSIGEVLAELQDEFPDVTISKIRFLESQGLIDPERTPSGYRKFYGPDLDRLRWVLFQQREYFLPLRVIKERLDDFGPTGAPPESMNGDGDVLARAQAGKHANALRLPFDDFVDADQDAEAAFRPVASATTPVEDAAPDAPSDDDPSGLLTRAELLAAGELTSAQLDSLEEYGIIAPASGEGGRARYDDEALDLARVAAAFATRGIEARHLRMYRQFAEREAALLRQVLVHYVRQRNPAARARLQEEVEEMARLGRRIRSVMLGQALREELAE